MLPTSARLLRLLTLLQTGRFWTGARLAEKLEVTERTVRRDVEKIRVLGYTVQASSGVAGGYQLGRGPDLPPLLFEDDEALAVALGLRSAVSETIGGMEEASVRALAKLEQLMPERLRRRVQTLQKAIVPLHRTGPRVDAGILSTLAAGCRNQELVRFDYESNTNQQTSRCAEPYGLVHSSARWYLAAWDVHREDWRTFRVDRIRGKVTASERFVARSVPDGGVANYVRRSVAVSAYTFHARIVLHSPLEEVSLRIPPLAGFLKPLDANTCLLETGGNSIDSLLLYVGSLGVEFDILGPPELQEAVLGLAKRFARAAKAGKVTRT
jgi:predicted DNA-binding transcriptional regulator YafY